MDKEFHKNADTFFSERHSNIIAKFRRENERSAIILQAVSERKNNLKNTLSDELWKQTEMLIDLINIHNNTESKFLYLQGFRDCIDLSHFIDTDLIKADFDEVILSEKLIKKDLEGGVYYNS